jgi:hypothetical protein
VAVSLKDGVQLGHLQPQLVLAARVVEAILGTYAIELVITSVSDGRHKEGSLHYKGRAFDFRTRGIPAPRRKDVFTKMAEALGAEFDVLDEGDHGHVEWDPR